jgi:DNA-binding PadR family transcriptional regulator
MDTGTITPLLKRLEKSGYVTRRGDVHDERKVMVELTLAGVALQGASQLCLARSNRRGRSLTSRRRKSARRLRRWDGQRYSRTVEARKRPLLHRRTNLSCLTRPFSQHHPVRPATMITCLPQSGRSPNHHAQGSVIRLGQRPGPTAAGRSRRLYRPGRTTASSQTRPTKSNIAMSAFRHSPAWPKWPI